MAIRHALLDYKAIRQTISWEGPPLLCHLIYLAMNFLFSFSSMTKQKNVGWAVPHGHSLQARCKDLGLYKLLGESRVLCSNGLWAPRMPSCVPTTLLTNFSGNNFISVLSSSLVWHREDFNVPLAFMKNALNRRQSSIDSHQNWHRFRGFRTIRSVGSAAEQHHSFGLHVPTTSRQSGMDLDWLASNLLHR